MPDLALERHRRAVPLDHPPGSVTREHLEYPTEDVDLVYLTAIGKTVCYGAENAKHRSIVATRDAFADKAVEAWAHDSGKSDDYHKVGVVARARDYQNFYVAGLATSKSTADFGLQKMVNGSWTTIGSESVDLALDAVHQIRLSVSGSSLTAYRGGEAKITATDTSVASGGFGVKLATASSFYMYDSGLVYVTARLLPPSSPGPRALVVMEVQTDAMFVRDLKRADTVDAAPEHVKLDAKRYALLKSRGFTDEEIELLFGGFNIYVDKLSVTWGAFEFDPASPTNVVAVYGGNPYTGERAVEVQVERARARGLRALRPPRDYREAVELYRRLRADFPHWLAGKDNFAYQALGHEVLEAFQAADFYYGELVEHKTHYRQLRRVPDWELRRTIEGWRRRLEGVSVLTEERDRHLRKLREVERLGW